MERETCNAFAKNIKNGSEIGISNVELLRMANECRSLGFKIDFDKETKRQMFHENPSINPDTRRKITIGGSVYESLVKKYGSPSEKNKYKINRDVKDMIHKTITKTSPKTSKTPVTSKVAGKKNIQNSKVVKSPKVGKVVKPKKPRNSIKEKVKPVSSKIIKSSLEENFEDLEFTDLEFTDLEFTDLEFTDSESPKEFINIKSFKKLFGFNDKKVLPKEKEPLYETKTIKQICKEFNDNKKIDPETGKPISRERKETLSKQCRKKAEKKPAEKVIPSQPKISREKLLKDYLTSNRPLREEISHPLIINTSKGQYDRQGNKKPPRVCNAEN